MSKTVDLFIQSDQPIEAMADTLGRATGWTVKPGEMPGTWTVTNGEQRADLHAHPYVNDGALTFERYTFALTAQVSGSRLTESPEAVMLRTAADRLRDHHVKTMLVHDLQFRERDGQRSGPGTEAGLDAAGPEAEAS
jgi:hypothetical protein